MASCPVYNGTEIEYIITCSHCCNLKSNDPAQICDCHRIKLPFLIILSSLLIVVLIVLAILCKNRRLNQLAKKSGCQFICCLGVKQSQERSSSQQQSNFSSVATIHQSSDAIEHDSRTTQGPEPPKYEELNATTPDKNSTSHSTLSQSTTQPLTLSSLSSTRSDLVIDSSDFLPTYEFYSSKNQTSLA